MVSKGNQQTTGTWQVWKLCVIPQKAGGYCYHVRKSTITSVHFSQPAVTIAIRLDIWHQFGKQTQCDSSSTLQSRLCWEARKYTNASERRHKKLQSLGTGTKANCWKSSAGQAASVEAENLSTLRVKNLHQDQGEDSLYIQVSGRGKNETGRWWEKTGEVWEMGKRVLRWMLINDRWKQIHFLC